MVCPHCGKDVEVVEAVDEPGEVAEYEQTELFEEE